MDRKEASAKWSEIAERLYLGDDYTLTKDDFSLVNEALNLFKYPVRKNGYWLEGIVKFDLKTKESSCSECGHQIALRFCPNCGADMRGEKVDTDFIDTGNW